MSTDALIAMLDRADDLPSRRHCGPAPMNCFSPSTAALWSTSVVARGRAVAERTGHGAAAVEIDRTSR